MTRAGFSMAAVVFFMVLTISSIVFASATPGWPEEGLFQFAVNKEGNIRLLNPDLLGSHSAELKDNEILIKVPTSDMASSLRDKISEQNILINNLNDMISQQNALIPDLEGEINDLRDTIDNQEYQISNLTGVVSDLKNRVSSLEGNSGSTPPVYPDIIKDGLVLWLPMNEGSGTNTDDVSGSGNNGTINNADWVPIDSGYALSMPGNSNVNCSNSATLASTFSGQEPFTIELWFKLTSSPTSNGIFTSKWSSDNAHGHMLRIYTSRTINFHIRDGNNLLYASSPQPATLNEWHHLAVSMDGNVTIYLDTVAGSSIGNTLSLDGNDGEFIIGQWNGFHLDGLVDEVKVYNRALSPAEILHNYEAQASDYAP